MNSVVFLENDLGAERIGQLYWVDLEAIAFLQNHIQYIMLSITAVVLIYPFHSQVGREAEEQLYRDRHVKLFGLDLAKKSNVCKPGTIYVGDCPRMDQNPVAAMAAVARVCREYKIGVVIPTMDLVLEPLLTCLELSHVRIFTSPVETVRICNNKLATYSLPFRDVRVPRQVAQGEYPVYLKPAIGYGARNHHILHSPNREIEDDPQFMRLEVLSGDEFTVDCYTTQEGKLLFALPRRRVATRMGMSIVSTTRGIDEDFVKLVQRWAEEIGELMSMRNVWFFQVKYRTVDGRDPTLLEIGARIPGAYATSMPRIGRHVLDLELPNFQLNPPLEMTCEKIYVNKYTIHHHQLIGDKLKYIQIGNDVPIYNIIKLHQVCRDVGIELRIVPRGGIVICGESCEMNLPYSQFDLIFEMVDVIYSSNVRTIYSI